MFYDSIIILETEREREGERTHVCVICTLMIANMNFDYFFLKETNFI